ncbi:MAG: YidC/Oxa1 family membrane protein insertase [Candidatus Saccharibacteria bacterium]|nr:YidC/Oxa1 family membrane protein insertase [Candidatus Saccharibacteria bacterium]
MFDFFIVQPIFNLLVFIYAILPGHNFGLALIIFTIIVRLLMWPLVKKQLHHAKAMRELQPEIKRIKKQTKGNRQQESMMLMALYKEKEISPFGTIGVLIVQLVILIGLLSGLRRLVDDPDALITFSYSFINHLPWLEQIAGNMARFDQTLFGVIDLTRSAVGGGGTYWPAMALVLGSAVTQFYSSKQLMPTDENSRSLKQILNDAKEGKKADQSEVSAATGRTMRYFIPFMIFIVTAGLPSALALYWFTGGLIGYLQQAHILNQDKQELLSTADKTKTSDKKVIEGEVVEKPKKKPNKAKKSSKKAKRRRKK